MPKKPKISPKEPRGQYVQLTIHITRKWYDVLEEIASRPRNVKLGLTVETLAALACESATYRSEQERLQREMAGLVRTRNKR